MRTALSAWAQATKRSPLWVPCLGGCGDVPHTAYALSERGSGVGKITELSSTLNDNDDDSEDEDGSVQEIIQKLPPGQPIRIHLRYRLANSTVLTWETIYVDKTMYIGIPSGCLPDASKDAFVALLEYAEDVLMCTRAIVYFSKGRPERETFIRTFMFMSFIAVPSESPILHFRDPDNIYMIYEVS